MAPIETPADEGAAKDAAAAEVKEEGVVAEAEKKTEGKTQA